MNADDAKTLLSADKSNRGVKRIIQKVAKKKPLSSRERSELEGVANAPKSPQGKQTGSRRNGKSENDLAIQARRLRVQRLRMNFPPVSIRDIAERLDVSPKTIIKDIEAIKKRLAEKIPERSEALLNECVERMRILGDESIADADNYTSAADRAALRRVAQLFHAQGDKLLADSGKIKVAPKKLETTGAGGGPIQTEGISRVVFIPADEDEKQ